MSDSPITAKFNLEPQEEMVVKFELHPDSTIDHSALINRDAPNQHPISSITGLREELNYLENKIISSGGDIDLSEYAKTEDVNSSLALKADKATTLAGYGITDAYTKEEVNNANKQTQNKINELDSSIKAEQKRAQDEESKLLNNQKEITKNLDSKADKSELENKIEYKDFEYNGEIRKTIQLDNFDSISSVTTEGEGVNLVMLSKWDVVDLGSKTTHSNINTKTKFGNASVVTVNDNEALITDKLLQILLTNNGNVKATVNEIEVDGKKFNLYDLNVDLSEYAKTEDLESKANKDEVYNKSEIDNIINSIEHVDAYTKTESDSKFTSKEDFNSSIDNINNELKSKADKSELENIVKFEQLTNRKVIKLDKNDALMSDGKLLAFVNDFGVIELGGTNAHTNISTQTKFGDDYIVTINDNAAIVTDKLLKTLFTNNGNVKVTSNSIEVDGKKFNLYDLNVDLSNYVTKDELNEYNLPIATAETLGGVKVGDGLKIDDEGILSVNIGSGAVTSVNGKTGEVELVAKDIIYKDDKSISEILDELLYVNPQVDLKGGGTYEIGSSINASLNWSINKEIISQNLSGVGELDPSIRKYDLNGVKSNATYKITVNDGKNTATDTVTFNFMNRRFWGVSENESLSNEEILKLNNELSTSRAQTRTFDCTGGKYFYFAIPTSLCSGISFKVGGLSFSDMNVQTIEFTNQHGYVNNYNVYRSGNIQTGSSIQVQVL